jgi:hypothetical protein
MNNSNVSPEEATIHIKKIHGVLRVYAKEDRKD